MDQQLKITDEIIDSKELEKEVEKTTEEKEQKKERTISGEIIEKIILTGDISKLRQQDVLRYYIAVCDAFGLSPITKPFDIIYFKRQNKTVLYPNKGAAEQLRNIHNVSIVETAQSIVDEVCTTVVKVQNGAGRLDIDYGSVDVSGLSGVDRANAIMKSVTKAKRRATFSLCGLGMMDETEIETLPEFRDNKSNMEKNDEAKEELFGEAMIAIHDAGTVKELTAVNLRFKGYNFKRRDTYNKAFAEKMTLLHKESDLLKKEAPQ